MDENATKALDRFRKLCSGREYCRSDIYSRACKALDGDAAAAAEIAEVLEEEGYICDRRYAAAFARDKSSLQGWGRVRIAHMLRLKGLGADIVEAALGEIDEEKADRKLESLVMRKRKTLEGDPNIRFKLLRFALSRGYDYDEVRPVVEKALLSPDQ